MKQLLIHPVEQFVFFFKIFLKNTNVNGNKVLPKPKQQIIDFLLSILGFSNTQISHLAHKYYLQ